jgi:hypothetical protein
MMMMMMMMMMMTMMGPLSDSTRPAYINTNPLSFQAIPVVTSVYVRTWVSHV